MKHTKKIVAATLVAALAVGASLSLAACNNGTDYVFEAEDAELAGQAQIEENKHEWKGLDEVGNDDDTISVVGYFGQEGDTITWTIVASKACTATVTIKAASAVNGFDQAAIDFGTEDTPGEGWKTLEIDTSKNEVFTLSVNGEQAKLSGKLPGLTVSMEDLGTLGQNMWAIFDYGYNNHGTCNAKVKLKEGENTIVIAAVSQGVNVDNISINASAELTAKA